MSSIAWWLVVIVAVFHVGFMCIEMFRWELFSQRAAGLDPATAEKTKALGFNQGLYNGFLAAGLAWALFAPPLFSARLALFFLAACWSQASSAVSRSSRRTATSLLQRRFRPHWA